ncbi:hypothetical protein JCM10207_007179 [Rhodosporidiobolus poonsookiae]
MGTTLQAPPFSLALDSALWSSELLGTEQGRAQLTKLHETWLEAGADIVETCTYQSSLPLFLPHTPPVDAGYTPSALAVCRHTMLAALPLACRACASSLSPRKPVAALSLGPYGASLQPGQEYGGLYPPPFGPSLASPSPSKPASPAHTLAAHPLDKALAAIRAAAEGEGEEVDGPEAHLAAWHLQRLWDFSASPAWSELGLLAFETVPVLAEARAIRRAMAVFRTASPPSFSSFLPTAPASDKPFLISFVFPRINESTPAESVRFPDPAPGVASLPSLAAQARLVIAAALAPSPGLAVPAAVGVNCTSPLHLAEVVRALTEAAGELQAEAGAGMAEGQGQPWLVLYPDGGAVYDVHSRTWTHPAGLTDERWAKLVADAAAPVVPGAAKEGEGEGVWGGVVLGGCCKAGPSAIRALSEEVRRRGWRA